MEKNQIVKLVSRIKDRFPDEFFRLSKEEKYEYVETFEKLFIRFDFDLVEALFGEGELMTNLVYSLIGLAGIINIGLLLSPIHHEYKK